VYYDQVSDTASPGTPIEDRLAVRQALLALPIEQRAAVTLCLISGCSHSEAAAITGVALGTVKSHVSRGRERLRRALEGGV
jgi:RNA polymerase sigma-70 factor (ECF subfamily)